MPVDAFFHTMPVIFTRDLGSYFLYSEGGGGGIAAAIFLIVFLLLMAFVLVLWVLLPFSVFGMKRLLRQCIQEQKKTNRLLGEMMERGAAPGAGRQLPGAPLREEPVLDEEALPEILPLDDEPIDF